MYSVLAFRILPLLHCHNQIRRAKLDYPVEEHYISLLCTILYVVVLIFFSMYSLGSYRLLYSYDD